MVRQFPAPLFHLLFAAAFVVFSSTAPARTAPAPDTQNPQVVAEIVEEFMLSQTEAYPGSAQVSVDTQRIGNQPVCDELETFLSGSRNLRSRMSVGVRCLAPSSWTAYVQVNLRIDGFYYVTNRTINAGDVLTLDDMMAREGDLLRLSRGTVSDPSQVIGYIATQRIPQGTAIKSSALRDANSVQRGQRVKTVAQGPGFMATGEGQALESGNPGAQIQVRSSSGQIITGIVIDATTVQIPM